MFGRFYSAVDFLPRYKGTSVILIFYDYEIFVQEVGPPPSRNANGHSFNSPIYPNVQTH